MEAKHISVVFVSTSLNYPIYSKRISWFRDSNSSTSEIGFIQPSMIATIESRPQQIILNEIVPGHYLDRVRKILRALPKFRKSFLHKDFVYAFGLDGAFIFKVSMLLKRNPPRLVVEIHDIRQVMLKGGLRGLLFRQFERWLLCKAVVIVVTSTSYISEYYENRLGLNSDMFYVLENKLWDPEGKFSRVNAPNERLDQNKLIVGNFGHIRCPIAWEVLKSLALTGGPRIEIRIKGTVTGVPGALEDIAAIENIIFSGSYSGSIELNRFVQGLDVVWSAGIHGKDSYRWARSCRFYYACLHGKPIISQLDSDEGRIIEELEIGLNIDITQKSSAVQKILSITSESIGDWQRNLNHLPKKTYMYTNDHQQLLDMLVNRA